MGTGRPEQAERVLAGAQARLARRGGQARRCSAPATCSGRWTARRTPRPSCSTAELRGTPELVALRARFAFALGEPRTALALAEPIEADGRAPEQARARAAVALAEALAVCGRRDEAVAVARRWEAHSERRLACAQALAHWLADDHDRATVDAERAYAAATDPQGAAVTALQLGHVWLSRGDLDRALRWFRESSVLLRSSDPVRMRPAALAGHRPGRRAGRGRRARPRRRRPARQRPGPRRRRGARPRPCLDRARLRRPRRGRPHRHRRRRRRHRPRRPRLRRPRPPRARPPHLLGGQTPQHCDPRCRAKRIVKGSDPPGIAVKAARSFAPRDGLSASTQAMRPSRCAGSRSAGPCSDAR